MQRRLLIIAVALPLVAIAAGIVRSELHRSRSRSWEFEISGYDPRDLLRGRYLRYRIELSRGNDIESCSGSDCCLCLPTPVEGEIPDVRRATCATARAQCSAFVRARELEQLRRFYVSEAKAGEAERLLFEAMRVRNARILVDVDASGRPQVRDLLLGGTPLAEQLSE